MPIKLKSWDAERLKNMDLTKYIITASQAIVCKNTYRHCIA